MTPIAIAVILAWLLDHIQYRVTSFNYDKSFNGYGSLANVVQGIALAPMQYRVVIPWLYWPFKRWGVISYEIIKIGLMALSLWLFWFYCQSYWGQGYMGMFIYALLLLPQFQFDYAEQYLEVSIWLVFITFIPSGNLWMLCGIVFVGGLARETSLFLPIVYFLATMKVWPSLILLILFGMSALIPRILYGQKKSYLDNPLKTRGRKFQGRNHLKMNLGELCDGFKKGLHYSLFSLLYVVLAIWSIWVSPLPYVWVHWFVIPFIVVWFYRAMFYETRVGMPLLVFIVPTIIGAIK